MKKTRVAIGIVEVDGRFLVARRPPGKYMHGVWEFPGGKIEADEDPQTTMRRELHEEVGIEVGGYELFLHYQWDKLPRPVDLYFYRVTSYRHEVSARERQQLRWVTAPELFGLTTPPANRYAINTLRLPSVLIISPPARAQLFDRARQHLSRGNQLLRLHTTASLSAGQLEDLAQAALDHHSLLLLSPRQYERVGNPACCGIHFTSSQLTKLGERPPCTLCGASTHNAAEIQQALALNLDYILLSPVRPTRSHPGMPGMGWEQLQALLRPAPMVAFALGGLQRHDLGSARAAGAHGVAGISHFW